MISVSTGRLRRVTGDPNQIAQHEMFSVACMRYRIGITKQ
ncbi:hypothetical protein B194_5403 [Serratia plymuthica A30]|nr:hypothetical protein B194_5403 [Serratia plymuthica A30]